MDIYVRKRGGQSSSAMVMVFVFGVAVGFMVCYLLLGVMGSDTTPTQVAQEPEPAPPIASIEVEVVAPEPVTLPAEEPGPEPETTPAADTGEAVEPAEGVEPAETPDTPPVEPVTELEIAEEPEAQETTAAPGEEDELTEAEVDRALQEMADVEDLWPARHLFVTITGTQLNANTRAFLKDLKPGGVVLLKENVQSRAQTERLVKEIKEAVGLGTGIADLPLIAVDQEGGEVNRLRLKEAPSAASLGRAGDTAKAQEVGRNYAAACAARGIGVMFAPVLDIYESGSPGGLRSRSFGSDADLVTAMGLAFADGVMEGGVIPVAKHYPGHGATRRDSHQSLAITDKNIDGLKTVMKPFAEAIKRDIPGLMVGHIAVPAIDQEYPTRPASISPVMTGLMLREELKYGGVVVTDDIAMAALTRISKPEQSVVQALAAGCDAVIFIDRSPDHIRALCRAIEKAVEDGDLPAEQLRASKARLDSWAQWLRQPQGLAGDLPSAPEDPVAAPPEDVSDVPPPAGGERIEHTVRSGDTLSKIAVEYGVKTADIQAWNEMNDDRIRLDQKLIVYRVAPKSVAEPEPQAAPEPAPEPEPEPAAEEAAPTEPAAPAAAEQSAAQPPNTRLVIHTVESGEVLSRIASKYGVRASEIQAWNGLPDDRIKSGFKIKVYVPDSQEAAPVEPEREAAPEPAPAEPEADAAAAEPEAVAVPEEEPAEEAPADSTEAAGDAPQTYKVQSGDTPYSIARKFGTTSKAVMELNGITDPSKLRVGQEIKIPQ